jgi:hypothetical protein
MPRFVQPGCTASLCTLGALNHRRGGTGVVSVQVLQEFCGVTRKLNLYPCIARRQAELLADCSPEITDISAAIDLHRFLAQRN